MRLNDLQRCINEVQAAVVALDLAQNDYERVHDLESITERLAFVAVYRVPLDAATRRLEAACDALKRAGWVKPRALIPYHRSGAGAPSQTPRSL